MSPWVTTLANWLFVLSLHSTCWLLLALMVSRLLGDRGLAWQEFGLRLSLFAGLATSTVQSSMGLAFWGLACGGARQQVPAPLADTHPGPEPTALLGLQPLRTTADGLATVRPIDPIAEPIANETATAGDTVLVAPTAIVLVAIAGAFALLGCHWLLAQRRALKRALQSREPECDPRLLRIAAEVATGLGLPATPRLSRGAHIGSPVAFGVLTPEVSLPPRTPELTDAQLRALFAHELAHVKRCDAAWLWAGALVQALIPWQLLVPLVRRRLHVLAELRCDAVAAHGSSAVAVAECLVAVAEWIDHRRSQPVRGALAMAAHRSVLRQRVEAALADRTHGRVQPAVAVALSLALLMIFTAAAPGIAGQSAAASDVTSAAPVLRGSDRRDQAVPALQAGAAAAGASSPDSRAIERTAAAEGTESASPARLQLRQLLMMLLREKDQLVAESRQLRSSMRDVLDDPEFGALLALLEGRIAELARRSRELEAALAGASIPFGTTRSPSRSDRR